MVKLVIFDLGGVIVTSPLFAFQKYSWEKGIPSEFVVKSFINNAKRLDTGQVSLSQFCSEMDAIYKEHASKQGLDLCNEFKFQEIMDEYLSTAKVVPEMLNASNALRKHGIKTCILTNNWANDTGKKFKSLPFPHLLHYFDEEFESCKLGLCKPDPNIYKLVCSRMNVKPSEVVFLDDSPQNLKPAKEMGMTTILVKSPITALKELKEVTGIDVFQQHVIQACSPHSVVHCYVDLKTGIRMHYVEMGQGPTVILLHGFPEFWFIWKYQITALAIAGYRVIAPDLRGMGETTSPYDISAYGREIVCADIIALMNSLYIQQATVVGRDLGGFIAWDLSLHYPERILAVINMTPFIPTSPHVNPLERLQANPGIYQYQLYFHKEGVAEEELQRDIRRSFILLIRGASDVVFKVSLGDVLERGGLFAGVPDNIEKSWILSDEDLKYFVETYSKTGFRGPLNWYRTMEKDWRWNCKIAGRQVQQPSLMITTGKDILIKPQFCARMDQWVSKLDRGHIEEASHFLTLESPLELNRIMVEWLNKVYSVHCDSSKL
ncbi:unnamed protein product [Porites evermanni]|uniref:AB hydrolase-1 domain-containing protein n=1 Tax=Porites evermanni TaxID=104178 RepID=A0ABN8STJ4_9CNID|nr:unnamed protein product [Porites evermanni]